MLFPSGMSQKVTVKVQVEFRLIYYNVAVNHISLFTLGIPRSHEGDE